VTQRRKRPSDPIGEVTLGVEKDGIAKRVKGKTKSIITRQTIRVHSPEYRAGLKTEQKGEEERRSKNDGEQGGGQDADFGGQLTRVLVKKNAKGNGKKNTKKGRSW